MWQIESQDSEIKRQNKEIILLKSSITLLVRGNKGLKSELQKISHVPPIGFKLAVGESSQPFYSHIGGYKLKLTLEQSTLCRNLAVTLLESEFEVKSPYELSITAMVIDQVNNKDHKTRNVKLSSPSKTASIMSFPISIYMKDGYYIIKITDIIIE